MPQLAKPILEHAPQWFALVLLPGVDCANNSAATRKGRRPTHCSGNHQQVPPCDMIVHEARLSFILTPAPPPFSGMNSTPAVSKAR
jgi:hypothetical protein